MLSIKHSSQRAGALGLLMVVAGAANAGGNAPLGTKSDPQVLAKAHSMLDRQNARFIENKGQWNQEARFLAKGRGLNLWYTNHGIRFDQRTVGRRGGAVVDMEFVGGHNATPIGTAKTNDRLDVYHGTSSVKNIGSYHELMTKGVLPGVDMRSYFDGTKPRYDLIVAPGTKPSSIAIRYRGAKGVAVKNGNLAIATRVGSIVNDRPVAYQTVGNRRIAVSARWDVDSSGIARFKLGAYDATKPLVIDPLVYGTYFGGENGWDEIRAAANDQYTVGGTTHTDLVIVGSSAAPDYPGTSRPFTDTLNPENVDAFIARIDMGATVQGTATNFSVLVGGAGDDAAQYLKIDALTGDLWLAGTTISGSGSNTFPVNTTQNGASNGVIGNDTGNSKNVFICRFRHLADGSLSFGTVGSATDPRVAVVLAPGIAANGNNGAVASTFDLTGFDICSKANTVEMAISGITTSQINTALVPNDGTNTLQGHTFQGHEQGALIRFTEYRNLGNLFFAISQLSSQYIEGQRLTDTRGVVLDANGSAYTVGTVFAGVGLDNIDTQQQPEVFRTTPGALSDPNGTSALGTILRATDVFIRRYAPLDATDANTGVSLSYSGLLGGNGDDEAGGITSALNGSNVFTGSAIAINADGDMFVTGTTNGTSNFPHTAGAIGGFQPPANNDAAVASDVFVARINAAGTRLERCATFGAHARLEPSGLFSAEPAGIAVSSRGYVYVTVNLRPYSITFPDMAGTPNEPTGNTLSSMPLTANALDSTYDLPASGGGPFPTTEAYLGVLNTDFSQLQYGSYIGGSLDDLVYAPNLALDGNVIVNGWTAGARSYNPPGRTSPPYVAFSSLPGYIGGLSVKGDADATFADQSASSHYSSPLVGINSFIYGSWSTQGSNTPSSFNITESMDGYVSIVDVGLPTPIPVSATITFAPTTILPYGSTTGTVSLNVVQATSTKVKLTFSSLANVTLTDVLTDANDGSKYVVVPAQTQSVSFTVTSNKLNAGPNGAGESVSVTATLPTGATASSSFTISPVDFALTLSDSSTTVNEGGTASATVSLVAPATVPAGRTMSFDITVPDTAANRITFPTATPTTGSRLLIKTVTIAAGQSSVPFSFQVGSVSALSTLPISATFHTDDGQDVVRQASLTVKTVGLLSIAATPRTFRGGTQLTVVVLLDGVVDSSVQIPVTFSLPSLINGTAPAGGYTITAGANSTSGSRTFPTRRVSRSQNVTITATFRGTTVSTVVTVVR